MRTLSNRLSRLEQARTGCIIVWQHHAETDEQAKARWKAEHPGEDPGRAGLTVIVVGWGDPQ